ncbi:Epsin-3 [Dirofilaria immitis]
MINKSDSVDVNYSSVNPISLLLTLNKTKPGLIHFNRFFELPAPVWFQFHSAIMLLVYFIIISLVLYVLLITIVICGRIWHYLYNLSRITRGVKAKTNLYMIVENIQEVRRLQVTRIKTESEQKLFNQIWNELHDKYQPNQEQKVEIFFSNDFNNKNMSQDVKS